MLDVALAYHRYAFLGAEFLTWLWYVSERGHHEIKAPENHKIILSLGNRIVIENSRNPDAVEQITIKGDNANLEEGMLTLRKGGLVIELHLEYMRGEHVWRFALKSQSLVLTGLKTPPVAPVESPEEVEGAVIEKIALLEEIAELLDALFQRFIKLRVSDEWQEEVVPRIREWIGSARG
jgi:hypothetical protein